MSMKRILVVLAIFASVVGGLAAQASKKPIVFVWYPNESGEDMRGAREEIGNLITKATGRKVEHKITTDYAIAIETIANGNAQLAWMGAQGYIEANNKSKNVQPMLINSGVSGTISDAVYYSWLAVRKGEETEYKDGSGYAIDKIQGKRFSFVSNSSTSGFKVPSSGIISYFSKKPEWAKLKAEELLEGGDKNFFKEVLFGGSHQGAAVNLITGKADIAAFCDTCVQNYFDLASGTANRPGAVYKVKADAAEPFNTLGGKEVFIIKSVPVLNGPFAYNTKTLTKKEIEDLQKAFTAPEVKDNPKIFVPKGSDFKGLFKKESDKMQFVVVNDAFYNPIRELSK